MLRALPLGRSRAETRRSALLLALLAALLASIMWRRPQPASQPLAASRRTSIARPALAPRNVERADAVPPRRNEGDGAASSRVANRAITDGMRKGRFHTERPVPSQPPPAVTPWRTLSTATPAKPRTHARSSLATAAAQRATPSEGELDRVACVHGELAKAMGWRERGPLFYLRGCNREAVVDFEGWSRKSKCARFEVDELLIHVGWTGPWLEHFLPDIFGLLDSFLATQDTTNSRLLFWLMDRVPDPATDPLVRRYTEVSGGAIEFRHANVTELSEGTCLEGRPSVWSPPGKIQPQTKSDLLRNLLLHKHGGVWVDTDTVLLRDLRPAIEYFGEFGGRFSMNQKYNNAILSMRKGSPLSRAVIDLACEHPKSIDRKDTDAYCAKTGQPCNPNWWYNHNPLQYFTRKGWMVAAPLHFFDPANNCVARGMLSKDGGREVREPWTLDRVFELVRGAYALHTRSYQATARPLSNTSTFALIFARARKLAEERRRGGGAKASLAPHGLRSAERGAEALYQELLTMLDSTPYPDPPFFPEGHGRRVLVVSQPSPPSSSPLSEQCVVFDTQGGRQPYELPMASSCRHASDRKDERAVWLWHRLTGVHDADAGAGSAVGYLRPSYTRTSNVWCLGAKVLKKSAEPRLQVCDGTDPRLRWTLLPPGGAGADQRPHTWVGLKSVGLNACVRIRPGGSGAKQPLELVGCDPLLRAGASKANLTRAALRSVTWSLREPTFVGDEASNVDW